MEGAKYRIIICLFLLTVFSDTYASDRSEIYYAYVNNRMDQWKNIIDRLETIKSKSNEQLLELVNYQYGYIGYCIGFKKKDEAKKYLGLAEKNIEILEKSNYMPSDIHAYKCAFYGFKIGLNVFSAQVNGKKSLEHGEAAIRLGKDNYFAHVQYGNMQFYRPAAFGGSKKEGMEYFLKAKEMLEKNPSDLIENWNYLSLLVIIGQSYTYIDDYNSAKAVHENILKVEPGFLYVKNELYPELLKKMGN
jgi:tetratricopeptide (TPR) repeat protein